MTPIEIKEKLKEISLKLYPDCDTEDAGLLEMIVNADRLYEKTLDSSRHWNNIFLVVNLDGFIFGFEYAEVTGDMSLSDIGWEMDWNTLCLVKAVEKTIITYERI